MIWRFEDYSSDTSLSFLFNIHTLWQLAKRARLDINLGGSPSKYFEKVTGSQIKKNKLKNKSVILNFLNF